MSSDNERPLPCAGLHTNGVVDKHELVGCGTLFISPIDLLLLYADQLVHLSTLDRRFLSQFSWHSKEHGTGAMLAAAVAQAIVGIRHPPMRIHRSG